MTVKMRSFKVDQQPAVCIYHLPISMYCKFKRCS